MFQHPVMVEILEEERRREKYAEARQWRMYQEALNKSLREPGVFERVMLGLAERLVRTGSAIQHIIHTRYPEQAWQEECETC